MDVRNTDDDDLTLGVHGLLASSEKVDPVKQLFVRPGGCGGVEREFQ